MKNKIKIKRKKYFSTTLVAIILLIIFLGISSSYALLSEKIKIMGNVSGQTVFTYYFKKPSSWSNNAINAYIWSRNSARC